MDAHNRYERRSLRDVLVAQGVLTDETADELMSSARENNESFGAVVVEAGHLTAWDLAKTVVINYQMPYIPLAGFQFDKGLAEDLTPACLYQFQTVPVGRFGKYRSFAVVEPPSRDCIHTLHDACGASPFFFVAETTEIQRLLSENVKVMDASSDTSWQSIFDVADRSVLDSIDLGGSEG